MYVVGTKWERTDLAIEKLRVLVSEAAIIAFSNVFPTIVFPQASVFQKDITQILHI